MLKKYQKFLEELKITRELTVEEAFVEFIEELRECENYYYGEEYREFMYSYSRIAQENINNKKSDPEQDFKVVNEFMSKRGYDLETVSALAEEYGRAEFNNRIEYINPSRCAAIDYYLYKITDKTFPLQGYSWKTSFDENASTSGDPLENEYLIRFGYGWHNTKYGKLCIEQNLGSVENFKKKILEFIPIYIINFFFKRSRKYKILKSMTGSQEVEFINNFKDNFLFMDDTYYAHLDELYDICKPHFMYEVSKDKFYDLFLSASEQFNEETEMNIRLTRVGEDIRIAI